MIGYRSNDPPSAAIDDLDRRILRELQRDGRLTNQELADRIGLSTSPCWRRTRRLEQEGLIRRYSAVLDARRIGFGVLVFVAIQLDAHSDGDASAFESAVVDLPQVVACHTVSGSADFMLQVRCASLDEYAEFSMRTLRRLPGIKSMTSSFALTEVKPYEGLAV